MDWRSVDFDWNRARAFLVTAEEGSLSAAARALGLTQPTLGRQVTALENELGVALFERGGRGLELTPSGLDLLEHVRRMGDAASSFSLTASGQSTSIEGSICITATEVMSAFVLPPILGRLRQLEPGIEIELIASNSVSDLKRREADIAVRVSRPTQSDLIARKVCDANMHMYAASSYLRRIGNPTSPEGFRDADFLGFEGTASLADTLNERGFALTSRNFPVTTENHLVHWELVKHGLGIGFMTEDVGDAEPMVERVLSDLDPFPIEVWLVAHRELKTSRRVRMVFDFLVSELS
ncbi:MAG: LysR family transcriptional regulator [Gammaproteobacteria bacterium]|nr:LysR family transcriptional regulator [Gammaproteobacteria bacterium]